MSAPAEWIAIPTRDRPATVRASLASHLHLLRQRGVERRAPVLLLDDSPGAENQARNRATTSELGREFGAPIAYVGRHEKSVWAEHLAREAGLPRGVLDFALSGWGGEEFTGGGNHNNYLLHLAGQVGTSFDDDITWDLTTLPGREAEWRFSSAFDPTEVRFPQRDEAPAALGRPAEEDVPARLCEPLGRDGGDLVSGATGPVLLSTCGLHGDSGMGNPAYLLKLRGASRASLLGDGAEAFQRALRERQMARGVPGPTLHQPGYFQSFAFALDHRELLPPCLPLLRAYDTLFAFSLRAIVPGALVAHLPWLVGHRPPETRRVDLERFTDDAAQTRFTHWYSVALRIFAQASDSATPDRATRLRQLGGIFRQIGRLPVAEAGTVLDAWLRPEREQELATLETLQREFRGEAPAWAEMTAKYAGAIQAALAEPWHFIPQESFTKRLEPHAAVQRAQALMADFGVLLECWPALFTAARSLRARGITLLGGG